MRALSILVMPVAITAFLKRAREADMTDAGSNEEWWPLNIFGGGGKSDDPYMQQLGNRNDAQYFGVIEVGGQKLNAVFDTGSFDLLVFGTNCTSCGATEDLYNSSKSNTGITVNFESAHSYGSGTCYSKRAGDKLKMGKFSVPNQNFWEVYDADMSILSEAGFQAILGIGPPSSAVRFAENDDEEVHREVKTLKLNGDNVTDRVKEIAQHYDDMLAYVRNTTGVVENLNLANMSVCLGKYSGSPGYFWWNDHATRDHPEKFTTLQVQGEIYWSASLGTVHLAGSPVTTANTSKTLKKLAEGTIDLGCKDGNCSAVVDTGTSLLVAPSLVVDKIYVLADEWEAAGGTCADLSQLPEFRFTLNGIEFSLPPEAYMGEVRGEVSGNLAKYMPRFYGKQEALKKKQQQALKRKNTTEQTPDDDSSQEPYSLNPDWILCEPLIMSLDEISDGGETWILGMPFFRKYYTTFHFTQKEGHLPEATLMSFSEQDGNCRPGYSPQVIEDITKAQSTIKNGAKSTDDASFGGRLDPADGPRRAQLKVDAKNILAPSFARNTHKSTRMQNLLIQQVLSPEA